LITIVSIKYSNTLEPYTPPVWKRYETIRNLRKTGLKPFLFLRPMIPGLIEKEYMDIIDKAVEYGAVGVVAGSLRVTERIIERLKSKGFDVNEIIRRAPVKPRGNIQVSIDMSDVKDMVRKYCVKNKILFFPEACMANIYTHGYVCWKMVKQGLVNNTYDLKYPSKSEIFELAERINVNLFDAVIHNYTITLYTSRVDSKAILLSEILHSRYSMCIKVKHA